MRWRCGWLITTLVLLGIGATACSDDVTGVGVTVRPFGEIQASDFVFERDPLDPSRGIFRVTTTEPMICAIVWGEDESFGRFNNSLAMDGTGIEQHDVVLPDVAPDVTYSYVIQGTTADGSLYRSATGTFRLGEGSGARPGAGAAPGENIAPSGSIVDVSSEFSSSFAASNAIDGDLSTEWATRADGDAGSITLDLGDEVDIVAVDFVTRSMADGSAITSTFTVSVDGSSALGPFPASTPAAPHPTLIEARGRVVRFDVESSTGGNVGAVEIRVFA